MLLVALERYKSLFVIQDPPCSPKREYIRNILRFHHARSAFSEVDFGHVLSRLAKNLESSRSFQLVLLQIFNQLLNGLGDTRQINYFSLDVFISYKATSPDYVYENSQTNYARELGESHETLEITSVNGSRTISARAASPVTSAHTDLEIPIENCELFWVRQHYAPLRPHQIP